MLSQHFAIKYDGNFLILLNNVQYYSPFEPGPLLYNTESSLSNQVDLEPFSRSRSSETSMMGGHDSSIEDAKTGADIEKQSYEAEDTSRENLKNLRGVLKLGVEARGQSSS